MIKWIFFDVGSTLVDESKAWEKRVSDTVKGSNISVSEFYKLMDDCALKNLIPYDDAVIISGMNILKMFCHNCMVSTKSEL